MLSLLSILSSGYSLNRRQQIQNTSIPVHFFQPSAKSHDSPMSKVFSTFQDFARQAIAEGQSDSRVLGSFELNTGVIFSNSNFEHASFLSQWAEQVVSALGLQSLAPKIGAMYILFKLMRVSRNPLSHFRLRILMFIMT